MQEVVKHWAKLHHYGEGGTGHGLLPTEVKALLIGWALQVLHEPFYFEVPGEQTSAGGTHLSVAATIPGVILLGRGEARKGKCEGLIGLAAAISIYLR